MVAARRSEHENLTNVGVGAVANGSLIEVTEKGNSVIHQTLLKLKALPITVGNTTGVSFGGSKIYTFPEGRILILGSIMRDISIGLDNPLNATPIAGTMGGDMSVGTTAPSDGTLTLTDVNLVPSTSIDPISDGITGVALAAAAPLDGTTTALAAFINMLIDDGDVANAASDVLEIDGEVEFTWINLGDY